jgi:alkylhydroperoxidase family enzyme
METQATDLLVGARGVHGRGIVDLAGGGLPRDLPGHVPSSAAVMSMEATTPIACKEMEAPMQSQIINQQQPIPGRADARRSEEGGPFLAPIESPPGLILKIVFFFVRRQFGKVMAPLTVFAARMPASFGSFYGKVSQLDKKLRLPTKTAVIIRERVASLNMCLFCMDATRWFAMRELGDTARFDALTEYQTSPLFTEAERAALDYATELTRDRKVNAETFARLKGHYSEREICDIVWLVASEHVYNLTNVGLNIGSDGLCERSDAE